jgi:WD40 repeat protein
MFNIFKNSNLMNIHSGASFAVSTANSANMFYDKKYNCLYNLSDNIGATKGITITDLSNVLNQTLIEGPVCDVEAGTAFAYDDLNEILYVLDQQDSNVLNNYSGIVRAYNTYKKEEDTSKSIPIDGYISALSIDVLRQRLYVASGSDGKSIYVYDLNNKSKLKNIYINSSYPIYDIICDPISNNLYVIPKNGNILISYDLNNNVPVNINLGNQLFVMGKRMLFDPIDQELFIPMISSNATCVLSVVDTKENSLKNNISITNYKALSQNSLALDSDKKLIYFMSAAFGAAALTVLDTKSLKSLDVNIDNANENNLYGLVIEVGKERDVLYTASINNLVVFPINVDFSSVEILTPPVEAVIPAGVHAIFRGTADIISSIKLEIYKGFDEFQTLYPDVQSNGTWAIVTTKNVTAGKYNVKAIEIIGGQHQSVAERSFVVE